MNALIAAAGAPHKSIDPPAAALLIASRCEVHRADAAEWQEIATHRPDLVERQYEELARQWLEIAGQAERKSRLLRILN
jgi:hypothetical protein